MVRAPRWRVWRVYLEAIIHHTKDEDEDMENGKSKDEAVRH